MFFYYLCMTPWKAKSEMVTRSWTKCSGICCRPLSTKWCERPVILQHSLWSQASDTELLISTEPCLSPQEECVIWRQKTSPTICSFFLPNAGKRPPTPSPHSVLFTCPTKLICKQAFQAWQFRLNSPCNKARLPYIIHIYLYVSDEKKSNKNACINTHLRLPTKETLRTYSFSHFCWPFDPISSLHAP